MLKKSLKKMSSVR